MCMGVCSDCRRELGPDVVHCPYCPTGVRTGVLIRDLAVILVVLAAFMGAVSAYFFGGASP